jgi:copper ion binding protein
MKTTALFKIKSMRNLLGFFSFFLIILVMLSCQQQGKEREESVNQEAVEDQQVTTVTIPVEGMSCGSCVSNVKRTVKAIDGVKQIDVSLEKREAKVRYISEKVSAQTIQESINEIGYKAGKPVEINQQ